MNKAYLETINGEWLDDFVYISKYTLERKGFEVIPFDGSIFVNGDIKLVFDKHDIMIGSVQSTKLFFILNDLKVPDHLGYPTELNNFYHREITKKTIKELGSDYPYFIKPVSIKLFTGDIIYSGSMKKLFTDYYDGVKPDTEIYVSEVVDIISEYRCFIHKDKIVGVHYYSGDFWRYPNISIVEDMVSSYDSSPISYTIDVAVTENDETIIVELNDMWAIGSYGLDRDLYVKLCLDRMNEIKGLKNGRE